jgi:hypothetical protein
MPGRRYLRPTRSAYGLNIRAGPDCGTMERRESECGKGVRFCFCCCCTWRAIAASRACRLQRHQPAHHLQPRSSRLARSARSAKSPPGPSFPVETRSTNRSGLRFAPPTTCSGRSRGASRPGSTCRQSSSSVPAASRRPSCSSRQATSMPETGQECRRPFGAARSRSGWLGTRLPGASATGTCSAFDTEWVAQHPRSRRRGVTSAGCRGGSRAASTPGRCSADRPASVSTITSRSRRSGGGLAATIRAKAAATAVGVETIVAR